MTSRKQKEMNFDSSTEGDGDVPEPRGAVYSLDVARSRFPYAIVWTPLPCISWFLPFIGHMGICDSRGVVYDFAGPYTIGTDNMAFSQPTRFAFFSSALSAPSRRPATRISH